LGLLSHGQRTPEDGGFAEIGRVILEDLPSGNP
jgi:hypothetical protein